MTQPAPRVSVVIPVFDPGRYIEPAIASILGQTIPAGRMEAIFVDDGSTDETPARLDRLAAEHPDVVRVIHIDPSGAPGRPRNVGLRAARGEYVQFLDADDELALDALERLVALADRNRSDVVVAKFASASIPRSGRLFARNVEASTLADMPGLVDSSLGPTKLFRRSFLERNDIRFPEGWRLMEDQVFTLRAYFRAHVVSILADHTCYFFNRRGDGRGLTAEAIDPDPHFRNLRTLVDLVEVETEPGSDLRDRILRRLIRVEIMRKVGEASYPDLTEPDRTRLFEATQAFLRDRIGPETVARLGALDRIRCELILSDRPEELLGLARRTRDLQLETSVVSAGWRNGVYDIGVRASFAFADAHVPLTVSQRAGRWFIDPAVADDWLGHPVDVTDDRERFRLEVTVRAPRTAAEWRVRAVVHPLPWAVEEPTGEGIQDGAPIPVTASANIRIDPEHVGPAAVPIDDGPWEVALRSSAFGVGRIVPVRADAAQGSAGQAVDMRAALVGDPGRVVVPVLGPSGLRLEVSPSAADLAPALPVRGLRVVRLGRSLGILLPMVAGPTAGPKDVALVLRAPDEDRVVAGRLRPWLDRVVLDAAIGERAIPDGRYSLFLRLGEGDDAGDIELATARIAAGRFRTEGVPRLGRAAHLRLVRAWAVRHVRGRLRSIRRRLPGRRA